MIQAEVGKLIKSPQQRDAIHIAIAPVVAGEPLEPGERIGFSVSDVTEEISTPLNSVRSVVNGGKLIGIVDPFLTRQVNKGEAFWMWLFPSTITADSSAKAKAEQWLRVFADECNLTYRQVIQAGTEFAESGEYFTQHGEEGARTAMCEAGMRERFWSNFAIVSGMDISEKTREGTVFSCSH